VSGAHRELQVGVTDLRRRPGTRRPWRGSARVEDLAISSARVPPGAEVGVDVELEAIASGVVVEGVITVPWAGECRRCLKPLQGERLASVREVFESHPTEGETYRLDDDVVDLEPMVRDAALLALPLAPLCAQDCRGPAPDAFPTGPVDDDAARPADPRWAALDEIRFDEPPGADEPRADEPRTEEPRTEEPGRSG
jgi:uncharacterized protein